MTRQLLSDCKDKKIKIEDGPYMAEVIRIYDAKCNERRKSEQEAMDGRQQREHSIVTYKPLAQYLRSHWAEHGLTNLTTDGTIPRIFNSKGPKVDGDPNHCFLYKMPAFPSGPLVSKKRKSYRKRNSLNSSSGTSSISSPCIDSLGICEQYPLNPLNAFGPIYPMSPFNPFSPFNPLDPFPFNQAFPFKPLIPCNQPFTSFSSFKPIAPLPIKQAIPFNPLSSFNQTFVQSPITSAVNSLQSLKANEDKR